jgi:hypothetical protein
LDARVGLLGLIGQTILLGVGAAFTPSLVALQVMVCSQDPWRRRALAVAVGGSSAFLLVGGLLLLGFTQLPEVPAAPSTVMVALRLVAAAVLIVLAVVLFLPHPGLQGRMDRDITGYVQRASPWVFLGVAFALSIKDVSSFVMLAPAIHDIAVSGVDVVVETLLLVLLFALALSPVLAPPLARLLFGHRADQAFGALYRFALDHEFRIMSAMAAVIGIYLGVTGLSMLA